MYLLLNVVKKYWKWNFKFVVCFEQSYLHTVTVNYILIVGGTLHWALNLNGLCWKCNISFGHVFIFIIATGDWEPDVTGEGAVRIWNPELVQEGQWNHMVFVFNKAVLKHSQFSLYINGQHIHTCKVRDFFVDISFFTLKFFIVLKSRVVNKS